MVPPPARSHNGLKVGAVRRGGANGTACATTGVGILMEALRPRESFSANTETQVSSRHHRETRVSVLEENDSRGRSLDRFCLKLIARRLSGARCEIRLWDGTAVQCSPLPPV